MNVTDSRESDFFHFLTVKVRFVCKKLEAQLVDDRVGIHV